MSSQLKHRAVSLFSLLLISLSFISCKVQLVPPYDDGIVQQIETTAKEIDRFYLNMLESESRDYLLYQKDYINFEVELNSLLMKNKVKPLNEHSIRICEITLQLWRKYKEEHHKDDTLSDGLIKLNRKTFDDLFFAMLSAERGKQIATNPPE
ncbi:hypothetical protein [Flavobacterium sp. NRK1]|uniref:hypothetical protein n=1 Tax=Flavobacterium sp. NRK1 TaxID=2954929 RepID=UPI002092F2AC|nr:hypothetical protein [Flavobacterium sp. NRK1]MCO6146702.1 hypothetical protein [Flavobacterium sp. NRK1]